MSRERGGLFGAAMLSEYETRAPAPFRMDDNYDAKQLARPLNAFVRDTVDAVQTSGEALDLVAERLEALETFVAGLAASVGYKG